MKARSPLPVDITPAQYLDAIFQPADRVMVLLNLYDESGLIYCPGSPGHAERLNRWVRCNEAGVWYLANPVTGTQIDGSWRSEANLTSFRYMVLESDVAPDTLWRKLLVQLPSVVAIYRSGRRSTHALISLPACESKEQFAVEREAAIRKLEPLGADRAAIRTVQQTRLPNVVRNDSGKLQSLLYLAGPAASREPIWTKEKARREPRLNNFGWEARSVLRIIFRSKCRIHQGQERPLTRSTPYRNLYATSCFGGFHYPIQLASALRWLVWWEKYGNFYSKEVIATTEKLQTRRKHPDLARFVYAYSGGKSALKMSPSMLGVIHFVLNKHAGPKLADQYMDALVMGTELRVGDPAYTARQWILKNRIRPSHTFTVTAGNIILRGWNLWRKGESRGNIKQPDMSVDALEKLIS